MMLSGRGMGGMGGGFLGCDLLVFVLLDMIKVDNIVLKQL